MLDESLSLGEAESPSATRDEDDFASEAEEGGVNWSRHLGMVKYWRISIDWCC